MKTKEERDKVRARCEAATEGPWEAHQGIEHYISAGTFKPFGNGGERSMIIMRSTFIEGRADMEFVAHARTDLPEALDELDAKDEAMRKAMSKLRFRATEMEVFQILEEALE